MEPKYTLPRHTQNLNCPRDDFECWGGHHWRSLRRLWPLHSSCTNCYYFVYLYCRPAVVLPLPSVGHSCKRESSWQLLLKLYKMIICHSSLLKTFEAILRVFQLWKCFELWLQTLFYEGGSVWNTNQVFYALIFMWQFDYRRVFGQPSDDLYLENCEMKSLVFVDFHTYGTYDYFFWIVQVLISWLKKAMKLCWVGQLMPRQIM